MSLTGQVLRLQQAIYKATDGRIGHKMLGVPTLLLGTTGRRSGQPRTNALVYARDGADYLVVASNGGSDKPPAWLYNLQANPAVQLQIGRERRRGNGERDRALGPRLRAPVEDRQRQQPGSLHRLPAADEPADPGDRRQPRLVGASASIGGPRVVTEGGWQGRSERGVPEGTRASEDAARRPQGPLESADTCGRCRSPPHERRAPTGLREACAEVAERAEHVRIAGAAIPSYAAALCSRRRPRTRSRRRSLPRSG